MQIGPNPNRDPQRYRSGNFTLTHSTNNCSLETGVFLVKLQEIKKIDNITVKGGGRGTQPVQFVKNPRILYGLLHEECLPHQQIVLTIVPDVTDDSAH